MGAIARGFSTEQRLAFGRVASLYDRARPSYPASAIDDVLDYASLRGGERAVEVGAGTGKATRLLAQRGLELLALEPDPAMAALARANCSEFPLVELRESDFECYRPERAVSLVFAAQSWHWVDPDVRYELAAAALAPEGTLAALWTLPCWEEAAQRRELRRLYAELAPQMTPTFPMHPASDLSALRGDWHSEVLACSAFNDPQVREHRWSAEYSPEQYAALISTHQDHILLEPARREQLLDGIKTAIRDAGGELVVPYTTTVCMARRS